MFEYTPYITLKNSEITQEKVKVKEVENKNGTVAVYVDALAKKANPISGEEGVKVKINITDEINGFMASYNHSKYWCKPEFGNKMSDIPTNTQLLIIEKKDGNFLAIVPVVNDTYKCVLEGGENNITAKIFSWCENIYSCRGLAFMYAQGSNPFELVKNCVESALEILESGTRTRMQRRFPDVFEYLGWCSWDSMQIRVDEKGILEKCDEFKTKNTPVKWAILDDMWAYVRDFYNQDYNDFHEMLMLMLSSSLYHIDADPIRFPNGLKGCISKIKEYGIKVGVWMPVTGYWRGIDPNGKAYELLKDYLIEDENGYFVPDWHTDKAYMYFKTFHNFYRKCGAEFIKTDNQSIISTYYKNLAPVGRVAKEYHSAMEASAGEHFDNAMINCMGTAPEDVWSRSVSPISRCSDDFKPEDKKWFSSHILQCAYSSVLLGQFYWCDWDMWWTDDSQAKKNSLMRAVSGGPIYVSDKIGRTKPEILMPLCLNNGKILRCDRPGIPTIDCIAKNPTTSKEALKIQNIAGDYGIMAVVNIDKNEGEVKAKICKNMIDGLFGEEYAVYEHYSKEVRILKGDEFFETTLSSPDDYRLYIFAPLKDGFAAIGRTDKFISPKTIKYVDGKKIVLVEDGPYAYIENGKLFESASSVQN